MKKIIAFGLVTFFTASIHAQDVSYRDASLSYKQAFEVSATVFTLLAFMVFILLVLRKVLEFRLKNKIINKDIPENVIASLLRTSTPEGRESNIRWFSLLVGLGTGLMIVNYTQPLGFHSVAIMAFSIAASFLGYYLFLKKSGK